MLCLCYSLYDCCLKVDDFIFVICSEQQDDKTGKEVILDDTECPLQIFRDWPADRGNTQKNMHTPTQSATIELDASIVPLFLGIYCPLQAPVS